MAGRTGPGVAQKIADFNQLGMQVNTENVLGIYAALAKQVERLRHALRQFEFKGGGHMPPLGGDPVSPQAATAFNQCTETLVALCRGDIEDLNRVAEGLATDARAYGKTEAQITTAFNPATYHYTPAGAPPAVSASIPPALRPLSATPSGPARPLRQPFPGGFR